MVYRHLLYISVSILLAAGCSKQSAVPVDRDYQDLLTLMTGSYDSSEQESVDSSYYNISLHMYPIWTDVEPGYIYVEQALASMQDKPYRQRVYKVDKLSDGYFASKVYTLDTPDHYIGKWSDTATFDAVDPSILAEREGCTVYLRKVGDSYTGSTRDDECKSTLRGASYATSVVTIQRGLIESWDQGFDDQGEQVWGAAKGGYIFKQIK